MGVEGFSKEVSEGSSVCKRCVKIFGVYLVISEIWNMCAKKTGVALWMLQDVISVKLAGFANVFKST